MDDIQIIGPEGLKPRESVCRPDLPEWVDGRVRSIRVGAWREEHVREHYRSRFRECDPDSRFLTDGVYFRPVTATRTHPMNNEARIGSQEALNLAVQELEREEYVIEALAMEYLRSGIRTGRPAIRYLADWYLDGTPGIFPWSLYTAARGGLYGRSERYEGDFLPYSQEAARFEREAAKAEVIAGAENPEVMKALLNQSSEELDASLKQLDKKFATALDQVQENQAEKQVWLETQLAEATQMRDELKASLRRTNEQLLESADRVQTAHAARESARAGLDKAIANIGGPEVAAILDVLGSDDSQAKNELVKEARAAFPADFFGFGLDDLSLMRPRVFLRFLHKAQRELHREVRKANNQRRIERGSRWRPGPLEPEDKAELVEMMNAANALRLTVLICHRFLNNPQNFYGEFRNKDLAFMRTLWPTP